MPVYLCCPGNYNHHHPTTPTSSNSNHHPNDTTTTTTDTTETITTLKTKIESYQYGIQVFGQPFPLSDEDIDQHWQQFLRGHTTDLIAGVIVSVRMKNENVNNHNNNTVDIVETDTTSSTTMRIPNHLHHHPHTDNHPTTTTTTTTPNQNQNTNSTSHNHHSKIPSPIRRIRHSEIILIDDVCQIYNRLWLRLRWPGSLLLNHTTTSSNNSNSEQHQQQQKKTFAGYIAMGSCSDHYHPSNSTSTMSFIRHVHHPTPGITTNRMDPPLAATDSTNNNNNNYTNDDGIASTNEESMSEAVVVVDGNDNNNDTSKLICRRTGLIYPSSQMLQLLPTHDDGISSISLSPVVPPQSMMMLDQVFCRICREGLHGDADDELPTAAADTDELPTASSSSSRRTTRNNNNNNNTTTTTTTRTNTTTTAPGGIPSTSSLAPTTTTLRRSPRLHPSTNTTTIATNRLGDANVVGDEYGIEEEEEEENILLDTEENDEDMDVGLQHPPMFDDDDEDVGEGMVTTAGRLGSGSGTASVASITTSKQSSPRYVGPIIPVPQYSPNTEALQNPMLKPCECSGSMAFVHYLCVEQWRCRSRHPNALNGLNCETCNKPYSLPPPTERRTHHHHQMQGIMQDENGQLIFPIDNNDWLDAMPPHVMQALRRPHIWWQMGAYIVRKRYLRPLVPVIMSPMVALYCRARRLLKKRGVARRRWACSLCRRRARWKCVRCLRSYYCSRQCQNVSWHIIHKHVCYKPSRFWSSIVFYGLLTLFLLPGIVRDPLMYDIIVCIVPLSFIIMGILGGGIATTIKKSLGYDVRGRTMELLVVLATIWLSMTTWGLVQAFFSVSQPTCYGTLGAFNVTHMDLFPHLHANTTCPDPTLLPPLDVMDISMSTLANAKRMLSSMTRSIMIWNLRMIHFCILQPAQVVYKMWDRIFFHSRLRSMVCTRQGNHHTYENEMTHHGNSSLTVLGSDSMIVSTLRMMWNWNNSQRNVTKETDVSLENMTTTMTTAGMLHNNNQTTSMSGGCFEHISNANANFILSMLDVNDATSSDLQQQQRNNINHRGQCASDLLLVLTLYCIAMITLIGSVLYKQHERRQRQQQQVHMNQQHHQARLHHIHPRQRHRPIFELRRNHRHLHQA